MIVKVIPPKIKQEPCADSGQKKKALRVAAYCRVSTDLDEQESSYEAQVSHYAALIRKTPGWRLAGIYADEGISGTSILKREDFRRLITDCEEKKIDLVITKSISRFARNTLDCLKYIRRLKELGIPVIFEKENINTLDARGELLITIMASIAQQESQSISQNVRMGIQYRFQQGKPMLNHSRFLGYTKKRGGPLCIVPAEAIVVRQIFRDFLEGMTVGEIIEKLEAARVPSPAGKRKWYHSTVLSMLRNEKYMGDLLLQKSYTTDFLTGARKRNQGNLPQYYVENDHEPIIPREVFLRVQAELRSRSLKKAATGKRANPAMHLSLMGKLRCGLCGAGYRRCSPEPGSRGSVVWRCRSRIRRDADCSGPAVKETALKELVVLSFRRLPECRHVLEQRLGQLSGELLPELTRRLESTDAQNSDALLQEKAGLSLEEVQVQSLLRLIEAMQETGASKGLPKIQNSSPTDIQKTNLQDVQRSSPQDSASPACRELPDFFRRTDRLDVAGPITDFRDDLVTRFLEKLLVYPDRLEIRFKAGIALEIPAQDGDWAEDAACWLLPNRQILRINSLN